MKSNFGDDVNRVATNRPVSAHGAAIVEQRKTKTIRNEGISHNAPIDENIYDTADNID